MSSLIPILTLYCEQFHTSTKFSPSLLYFVFTEPCKEVSSYTKNFCIQRIYDGSKSLFHLLCMFFRVNGIEFRNCDNSVTTVLGKTCNKTFALCVIILCDERSGSVSKCDFYLGAWAIGFDQRYTYLT